MKKREYLNDGDSKEGVNLLLCSSEGFKESTEKNMDALKKSIQLGVECAKVCNTWSARWMSLPSLPKQVDVIEAAFKKVTEISPSDKREINGQLNEIRKDILEQFKSAFTPDKSALDDRVEAIMELVKNEKEPPTSTYGAFGS